MDSQLFGKSTVAVKDGLTYKEQDGPSTGKGDASNTTGIGVPDGPAAFTPPVTGSGSFGTGTRATVTVDPAEAIRHGQ